MTYFRHGIRVDFSFSLLHLALHLCIYSCWAGRRRKKLAHFAISSVTVLISINIGYGACLPAYHTKCLMNCLLFSLMSQKHHSFTTDIFFLCWWTKIPWFYYTAFYSEARNSAMNTNNSHSFLTWHFFLLRCLCFPEILCQSRDYIHSFIENYKISYMATVLFIHRYSAPHPFSTVIQ